MSSSLVPKTYIRPDNKAILTCPQCGHQREVIADKFKEKKHKLKVKCLCQNVFEVIFEFRSKPRKKTLLTGTYINHSQDESSGNIVVENISMTGLAFRSYVATKFNVGDELSVEFNLDDDEHTQIKKKVIVRNLTQRFIGCEFEGSEIFSITIWNITSSHSELITTF